LVAREQRRLAAIVAADVVGYSRLMGRDEAGTLGRLREHRKQRFEPALARHGGRLVKLTGDGALAEFPSAVDALSAAIEFQQAMREANAGQPDDTAIVFRIGLHLGDLIVDGDDLYGDGVNIAARLEAEAEPGGIVVSGDLHNAVAGRLNVSFRDLGDLALKNIERPVRILHALWVPSDWPAATAIDSSSSVQTERHVATSEVPLALPDKPSIAVLPFQNMSGDVEQEYFADGIVEEIITALSRFRSLFVIARNSTFTYKGKPVDVRTVSQELGVRYVLEGSVRKAGNRVRITGQLIQADTGAHIWAERYDGDFTDIFELQDRVASDVVGAIAPRLEQAEIDRAKRKPTEHLGAYDCYLRGMASSYQLTADGVSEALQFFYRAIELDPGFALAHGMAAMCYQQRRARAWSSDPAREALEAARLARRALQLDADDAKMLSVAGYTLAFVVHDLEIASKVVARALTLNQNLALAWMASGWVNVWSGTPGVGIDHFARAMRLSPRDSMLHLMRIGMAHAHYMSGHYDEAASWVDKETQERHGGLGPAMRIAAASAALAGHQVEAGKLLARYLQVDPDRRESNLEDALGPYARAKDIELYKTGLRKAGLPP
jgi:TolB-like protein/class 3 adenylate cyclase/Tfp pilus assembly protein PilF